MTGEDGRGWGGNGTPPPPERARTVGLTTEMTAWHASRGRRRCRARAAWRQTMTVRGPCRSNMTAPTAPGQKTACTCAASTTYWRRRRRRGVEPKRGPEQGETATGPPERRQKRGERRRQRRQRLGNACSKRAAGRRTAGSNRPPPNRLRTHNACGHPGGNGGGETLTWQCTIMARSHGSKGDPLTWQRDPSAWSREGGGWGTPYLAARANQARSGGRVGHPREAAN